MRVNVTANVLTLVTDITEATIRKGMADLTAYDEKKNPVYKIALGAEGNLSQYGIVANAFVEGKAAVVIVAPLGTTKDEMKAKYGKAVLAAQKYIPVIAAAAESEEALINEAFGDTVDAE
jgi:hypothetical protein